MYFCDCREFSLLGLALIAVGTGGIKPCVSAFGGDQFKLPEQERQLQTFFSVFYFAINAGSLISTALTPILRYLEIIFIVYCNIKILKNQIIVFLIIKTFNSERMFHALEKTPAILLPLGFLPYLC